MGSRLRVRRRERARGRRRARHDPRPWAQWEESQCRADARRRTMLGSAPGCGADDLVQHRNIEGLGEPSFSAPGNDMVTTGRSTEALTRRSTAGFSRESGSARLAPRPKVCCCHAPSGVQPFSKPPGRDGSDASRGARVALGRVRETRDACVTRDLSREWRDAAVVRRGVTVTDPPRGRPRSLDARGRGDPPTRGSFNPRTFFMTKST